MKTNCRSTLITGTFSLAIGFLLNSCVDPSAVGHSQASVTTYRTGYEVRSLPPGYRTETIAGTRYFHHGGTYYRPRGGGYVVVEAPRGGYGRSDRRVQEQVTVIRELPRGYRTVNHRGTRYYQHGPNYYQRQGSGYVAVRGPF